MPTTNATPKPNYRQPTVDDLRDDARLRDWLQTRFDFAGVPLSHYALIRGFAAAERSQTIGDDPAKLLSWLITRGLQGDWSFVEDDWLERGKQRVSALADAERPQENTDLATALAERLGAA